MTDIVDIIRYERPWGWNGGDPDVFYEKGMKNICVGDKFKIIDGHDENGCAVFRDSNGYTTFVATSEPFMTSEGILGVNAYGYEEIV